MILYSVSDKYFLFVQLSEEFPFIFPEKIEILCNLYVVIFLTKKLKNMVVTEKKSNNCIICNTNLSLLLTEPDLTKTDHFPIFKGSLTSFSTIGVCHTWLLETKVTTPRVTIYFIKPPPRPLRW